MMCVNNIKPKTEIELVFSSICMVLSCMVFGYMMNAISCIFTDIDKSNKEYKKDLNVIN